MPLLESIYLWSRISALVAFGVMGFKGLYAPRAAIAEVPLDAGFGWEKSIWFGDETIRPDMPDPIQVQIDRCDKISEKAPGMRARIFCKVQKVKLQSLLHVLRILRKAYSFANTILPTFGGGGYVMVAEILFLGGLAFFTVRSQHSCLKMLSEKVSAVYQSVTAGNGRAQLDPTEEDGMAGQKYEVEDLKPMNLEIPHEADELGTPGGEDLTFSGTSGGRRFHGELAFQDGINEEGGASSDVSGSEMDGKMKKEVRFMDDSFDDRGISDAYVSKTVTKVSQRRVSPVKRIVSEPASKSCSAKMTRSVPAAGTGAGSRSGWHP